MLYNGDDGYRASTMFTRFLSASMPVLLAGTLGLPLAHADIFTWVDAYGTINVSNLPPPDGVAVTKVTHEVPSTPAREDAARAVAQQSEVRALEARVGQLEGELEMATRQAPPPPMAYAPAPAPPVIQYFDFAPPAMQYATDYAPTGGCDPTWLSCGLWWAPGYYPVVVLGRSDFRRPHRQHGGEHFATHQPSPMSNRLRRG